ncbi:MAG TPA: AI-2E family transporter [Bryobacteraceae bacterium]|jgi:predicted PurR-regulated permease PerM|nr:AI-2E family transporter [Bryobacteraceae bacterium]
MFGLDYKALRVVWTVFLFVLVLSLVYTIRETLLLFAAAIFFAYMLSPLVGLVGRYFTQQRRALALAIVYVLLIGALVGLGFALIPQLVAQAANLVTSLPALLSKGRLANMPLPEWLDPLRAQIVAAASQEAANLGASVMPFLHEAGTRLLSGVSLLLPTVLLPILAFFFLKDGETIVRSLVGTLEEKQDRNILRRILMEMHTALKNYIRALVILALITFASYSIFLRVVGVGYELLLAGILAVLEFIPAVGPAVGLVLLLIVSFGTGSGAWLAILIFFGIYRVFQDYVVNPYLMRAGLELHPLLVLFGVFAGERIGGVAGMFFSVPVIALLKVLYTNLKSEYERRQLAAA